MLTRQIRFPAISGTNRYFWSGDTIQACGENFFPEAGISNLLNETPQSKPSRLDGPSLREVGYLHKDHKNNIDPRVGELDPPKIKSPMDPALFSLKLQRLPSLMLATNRYLNSLSKLK